MRKLLVLVPAVALMALVMPVAPAAATPPVPTAITVTAPLPPPGETATDPVTFTATGPICGTGEVEDLFGKAAGFQSGKGVNLQILKEFTCDDGSGSFVLKLQVRIVDPVATFNWKVVSGTDDYEDLHGAGSGSTVVVFDPPQPALVDMYEGKMHIDPN